MSENLDILKPVHSETGFKTDYKKSTIQEFIKDGTAQSYSDFMADQMVGFMAKNMSDALYNAVEHEIDTPKIILFFEHTGYRIRKAFSKLRKTILDVKYKHEKIVKIRKAGSMMTLNEAMDGMSVLKTLKDFADLFYNLWAEWDKNFNWLEVNTFQYSDTPDNRIGWRQTWLVTAPGGSDNHTYPVAFTDKPFYNLKLNAADAKYIQSKYPKFLECVDNLRHGGHRRENELYRKEMTKKYGEH